MAVGEVTGPPPNLPWRTAFLLAKQSLGQRRGKSLIMILCLSIAVAFLMSTLCYEHLVNGLLDKEDVHTQALLERAGRVTADSESMTTQQVRRNWILAITSLIALAGISNTMLLGITERFREIGTMKCLGAPDRLIVRLFFIETFLLGGFAALIGLISGFILSVLQFAAVLEIDLHGIGAYAFAFLQSAPIAFVGGTVLTILAALYPAQVASRMRPAEALRSEI